MCQSVVTIVADGKAGPACSTRIHGISPMGPANRYAPLKGFVGQLDLLPPFLRSPDIE